MHAQVVDNVPAARAVQGLTPRRSGSSTISGNDDGVVRLCPGEGRTGGDIVPLQIRKIAQHFGLAYASGKEIEDVLHPNTHAADARATAALVRVEGDAIHNSHAEGSKGSAAPIGIALAKPPRALPLQG
jgi:hypothetical protein